jgi:hypothetical protein
MSDMLSDTEYYYQRAETELEMAQRSDDPSAVKVHYTLASHYLERIYRDKDCDEAPRGLNT